MYEYEQEDLQGLVDFLNIETRKSGKELMFKNCPICGSSGPDKFTSSINVEKGLFNCKRGSCPSPDLNFFQLCREVGYQIPRLGKFRYYKFKQIPEKERDCRQEAVDYLKSRAIPEEITRRYFITTKREDPELLVIPFYDENNVCQMYKFRHTKPKPEGADKSWSKEIFFKPADMGEDEQTKKILFGMYQCKPENDGRLIITEGQLDSLSVAAAGYANAVSVPNGKNGFTWLPNCREWIEKNFKKIIVFGDYENGEISLLDRIRSEFDMPVLSVRPADYLNCKDANDLLREYGPEEVRKAVENAEISGLEGIKDISEVEPFDIEKVERTPTGFPSLDMVCGGLMTTRLYILTGKRGQGKSTVASQMIANVLKGSKFNVLAYSGEFPNNVFQDWLFRQMSRHEHFYKHNTGSFGMQYQLSKERQQHLKDKYKNRLYMIDDCYCGDILSQIERAVKCLNIKVVLIDNLMSLVSRMDGVKDMFLMQSKVANQLAAMARRLNVCVILIVHPKKGSDREDDALDAISGSADIVNACDFVIKYTKANNESGYLELQKNRYDGKELRKSKNASEKSEEVWLSYDNVTKRLQEENALTKFREYHGKDQKHNGSFDD